MRRPGSIFRGNLYVLNVFLAEISAFSVRGTNCTPHQFSIDQMHKHSETALDTPKKEGTESSFPVKVHLIVLHKAWLSVKSHGFTDEVVKMSVSSVKWQVFTDDLKKQVLIAPLRSCNHGAKSKRKIANP